MTLARVPGDDAVTLDEVVLLPGDAALLAPAWVPWHERLRPGDLSVGDVLPSTEDDPRLVPSYIADDDSAEDPAGRVVAQELGLGRERVLSPEGRREAVGRWREGEFGPRRRWPGTRPAPAPPAASTSRWPVRCGCRWAPAPTPTPRPTGTWWPPTTAAVRTARPAWNEPRGSRPRWQLTARYDTADFDVFTRRSRIAPRPGAVPLPR